MEIAHLPMPKEEIAFLQKGESCPLAQRNQNDISAQTFPDRSPKEDSLPSLLSPPHLTRLQRGKEKKRRRRTHHLTLTSVPREVKGNETFSLSSLPLPSATQREKKRRREKARGRRSFIHLRVNSKFFLLLLPLSPPLQYYSSWQLSSLRLV